MNYKKVLLISFFLLFLVGITGASIEVGNSVKDVVVNVGSSQTSSGSNEHLYALTYPEGMVFNITNYDLHIDLR